jgi:hypothetical protein
MTCLPINHRMCQRRHSSCFPYMASELKPKQRPAKRTVFQIPIDIPPVVTIPSPQYLQKPPRSETPPPIEPEPIKSLPPQQVKTIDWQTINTDTEKCVTFLGQHRAPPHRDLYQTALQYVQDRDMEFMNRIKKLHQSIPKPVLKVLPRPVTVIHPPARPIVTGYRCLTSHRSIQPMKMATTPKPPLEPKVSTPRPKLLSVRSRVMLERSQTAPIERLLRIQFQYEFYTLQQKKFEENRVIVTRAKVEGVFGSCRYTKSPRDPRTKGNQSQMNNKHLMSGILEFVKLIPCSRNCKHTNEQ